MTRKKIDSEKAIERKLREEVEKANGLCVKMQCDFFSGLPDRLVLLPEGKHIFVELKTTGQKPRPIQVYVHKLLRDIGHTVEVIDTLEGVQQFIEQYVRH